MLRQTQQIESPCKLICKLDLDKGLCTGCGRSRDEIGGWLSFSPAKRAFIMTQLDKRLENLDEGDNKKT
jgi:predicted Fe-S protein YdhL (DUF1289 family)